jgi:uncharacterized Ntn-hydrolase superfamily protein
MRYCLVLFCFIASIQLLAQERPNTNSIIATYSIVAWDSSTGDLGVAVQSKFLGVGAIVPYAKAGVGAIATQAIANTNYGPRGLEMIESGSTTQQTVERLIQSDTSTRYRQVGIVDAHGNSYAYTGPGCSEYAGHICGRGFTVQGNAIAGREVVVAMARTFENSSSDLAERLLNALDSGEKAGGIKQGKQSAALLVVRENGGYGGYNDRFIDIRVDDDPVPLVELRRIYNLWKETFLFETRLRIIDELNRKKKFILADEERKHLAESLNSQIRLRPDDPELLSKIALILTTSELDKERALELAKRAVKLTPDKLSYLDTMAECHFRLGHYEEAIAIETELVTKDPTNDNYWKQLQKFKEAKQKAGN